MRARARTLPPLWEVAISAHDVPPRWHVPAATSCIAAVCARQAREFAAREAQRAAGVPPLRSLLAMSIRHAQATPARRTAAS